MIKLKKLMTESVWNRKFGEPLPTLDDVMKTSKKDHHGRNPLVGWYRTTQW